MHPFHDYVGNRLAERIKKRHVVVWYDPDAAFEGYARELGLQSLEDRAIREVRVGERDAKLACYCGSFFELRQRIEVLVSGDKLTDLLIYVPNVERDKESSPLMELELGGDVYRPQFRQLAREALKKNFTEGKIDDLLEPENTTYEDVAQYCRGSEGGEGPSALRNLYEGLSGLELLTQWLVSDGKDADMDTKGATPELSKLIDNQLGLMLPNDVALADMRERTLRYCLLGEFRDDLTGDAPSSLSSIPMVEGKDEARRVHRVCQSLRQQEPELYCELADSVQEAFHLPEIGISAAGLGSIDTFRFEEQDLLRYCEDEIVEGRYENALQIVDERARSFWVDRSVARRGQWNLCRLMAELGVLAARAAKQVQGLEGKAPAQWVGVYSSELYECDQIHRRLEGLASEMPEEPESVRALAAIRREHDNLTKSLAEGFSAALRDANWSADGILHQTHIYSTQVATKVGKTAYFLVDAMRYEMGAELRDELANTIGVEELKIECALAALPSITEVGMAALLPGAEATFSVVQQGKALASKIGDEVMGDVTSRLKYFKAQVPGTLDITLDELVKASEKRVTKLVDEAALLVVRSQEIDKFGEQDNDAARVVMNLTLQNLRKAILKLGKAGVEQFVITADHGHLFAQRRQEDMRADAPGGDTVDLHRRCWAGRGGSVNNGFAQVTAPELGYDSDLEFIFPTGLSVFRSGGGLAFHHGSTSLQEMVIPVLELRYRGKKVSTQGRAKLHLEEVPDPITNRMFSVKLAVVTQSMFASEPIQVRAMLTEGQEEVGRVLMVIDGDFDDSSKVITLNPAKIAAIGIELSKDSAKSVIVEIRDAKTDAVLAKSNKIAVSLSM